MKVYFSSDIHFDHHIKNQELWYLLYEECKRDTPDVLIICGDLAESLKDFHLALSLFKDLNCPKLILPGNHDLWNRIDKTTNAWDKYKVHLPKISTQNNWHYLPTQPFILDNWIFVGSPLWYDYSLMPKNHPFTTNDFQKKQYKNKIWQDSKYIDFPNLKNDFEISKYFYQELESHLQLAQNKKIFCCSHFPSHHEIFNFTKKNWDKEYFGAFMGSNLYQKLLEKHKVSYFISGHVHRQFDQVINDIRVILNPVGYTAEWVTKKPEEQIKYAIKKVII
ncbi:MAG: hypothetical protein COB02_02705 [Candidatus Cloacimonadota bacterium]|nr:MAG: hypothetical protein COB02_02705 [Candidatus Cloacimonadota bacterium]